MMKDNFSPYIGQALRGWLEKLKYLSARNLHTTKLQCITFLFLISIWRYSFYSLQLCCMLISSSNPLCARVACVFEYTRSLDSEHPKFRVISKLFFFFISNSVAFQVFFQRASSMCVLGTHIQHKLSKLDYSSEHREKHTKQLSTSAGERELLRPRAKLAEFIQ